MKTVGKVIGIIIALLVVLYFIFTRSVDETPYFESDYFKNTTAQIDSLKAICKMADDSLLAGFAKISITPFLNSPEDNVAEGKFEKVPLAGYGARKGAPATDIHDSIFVKAAALKAGNQQIVLVGADLLIMPPNIIDSVTAVLAKKGFSRSQLYFSATHSHSSIGAWGPGFVGRQFAGEENKNLERWLVGQIKKAVLDAVSDLRPAKIGTGNFKAGEYTRNRLIGKLGTKNDDFNYIFIEQLDGKKAIIGSFAAHATTLGDKNMQISADYPGFWERKMEKSAVDYALFFAGSVGSQSPVSKGDGFDEPKYIGEALADSLLLQIPQTELNAKVPFSAVSVKMQLPEYHFRLTTKRNMSTGLTKKLMPYPKNVYVQAVRIGNMIWISTPCDFSGEYALQIKNALLSKGFNANITSFNGSYVGYIIPGRYFYLDKYEPKLMGWFGPNMGDYTMDIIRQISGIVTQKEM